MKYRPWGPIDWTLSISGQKEWHFVGAIGTEERSLCSWKLMKGLGLLHGELFAQICDVESDKYRHQTHAALEARFNEFHHGGGDPSAVRIMDLMTEGFEIQNFSQEAVNTGSSVVLDITSMPKRYFFLLLQALTESADVKNLLVTYSTPATYADGALYEDVTPWKNLPGFGGEPSEQENLIVSIGFLVESLREYFSKSTNLGQVKMLIPFPAPLSALKRTWESIANIERERDNSPFEKYRIGTLDMSSAFDRIVSLASTSQTPTAFAPFGPKPTAAAMCLYAIQKQSAVYYPQPTVYRPDYSRGIRNDDPASAVSAYWIKHERENLYEIV